MKLIAAILITIVIVVIIRRIIRRLRTRRIMVYDLTRTTSLKLSKGKIATKADPAPRYPTKQQLDAMCKRIEKELIND